MDAGEIQQKDIDTALALAAIIASTSDAIINTGMDGIIHSWNPAAESMFEYMGNEIIGKHISILVPPNRYAEETHTFPNISINQVIAAYETNRLTKSGQLCQVVLSVFPVKDNRQKVTGACFVLRDASGMKLVEERNAMLAAIVQSSTDAIVSKDLNGFITSWNKAAEHIFGYTEAEVKGKHITIIIPKDRRYEEDIIISKVRKGEKIEHYQTIRQKKNGDMVPVVLTVSPVMNASNEVIGVSKIARNITEQVQAKAKVAMLAAIVDSSDDAIISKNLDGYITSWNKSAEQILGYRETEAIGKHITMIIPTEGRAEETMIINRIKAGEKVEHFETRRVRKDGSLVDLSITVSPIKNEKGDIMGASKVARDISEKVTAKQQLESYAEELKKLNRYKDEFISVASHELNTPITSLKGYLHILENNIGQEKELPPLAHNFINKAITLSNKLAKLVKDLLDVSKIESGKLLLQMDQFDSIQLLLETIESMRVTSRQHNIVYNGTTQPVMITGDKDRLEQVFINLVSNALKYSPKADRIVIDANTGSSDVFISVEDFGIGIPAAQADKIFSRFFRAEGLSPTYSGLGIGLFLSHQIIKAHNGSIVFRSEEGKGSVFTISLPIYV